jgi:hypothetical protein
MSDPKINVDALKSEVRTVLINQKANACPIAVRLAWHASGTFDKKDSSGGSDGATMRFEPESTDDANAGLSIVRDLLLPVKANHPEVSYADLWTIAGCAAVEFLGGPKVAHTFGRTDEASGSACPANGRLPDAAQGAAHLRDVFYRMGFNDQEIVALSGAHTLGRCHRVRSGYDGPWTRNPLKFDNTYFRLLMNMEWTKKKWDGPEQFEDPSGELMMLPTDLSLKSDPQFRKFAEAYAKDEQLFFDDFSNAFAKLIALGAKQDQRAKMTAKEEASAEFREAAMHGSLDICKKLAPKADVHAQEAASGRTALHKAAFWGHDHEVTYLTSECKLNVNVQDYNGDTALHDAARFGHADSVHHKCVEILLAAGADVTIKNKRGLDALATAQEYGKTRIAEILRAHPLAGKTKSRL